MRDQDNPFTRPLEVRGGVLVADGYGIRVHVSRGRLVVEDGVGPWSRRTELHRATGGLRRLVVLGEAGFVTLEAVRWLAGVGASLVHLDREGSVLACSGNLGADLPALRRAQALAAGSEAGLEVARYLVVQKLRAQAALAGRIGGSFIRHPSSGGRRRTVRGPHPAPARRGRRGGSLLVGLGECTGPLCPEGRGSRPRPLADVRKAGLPAHRIAPASREPRERDPELPVRDP